MSYAVLLTCLPKVKDSNPAVLGHWQIKLNCEEKEWINLIKLFWSKFTYSLFVSNTILELWKHIVNNIEMVYLIQEKFYEIDL